MTEPTKAYYLGTTVKAIENGIIEGYLIPFTNPDMRDLHGQYFDANTNLMPDDYPIKGLGVLYNHGFDQSMSIRKIGKIIKSTIDDLGVWVQAQLDMRDEYEKQIYELAKRGVLAWSSGALPQGVEYDDDGYIKRWPPIEGSLTPTPAMPQFTVVSTTKSIPIEQLAKEDETGRNVVINTNSITINVQDDKSTLTSEDKVMADYKFADVKAAIKMTVQERVQMIVDQLMTMVAEMEGGGEMDSSAIAMDMTDDATRAVEGDVVSELDMDKLDEASAKSIINTAWSKWAETKSKEIIKGHVQKARDARSKREQEAKEIAAKAVWDMPLNKPQSNKPGVGSDTKSAPISVGDELKYQPYSLDDMLLAAKLKLSLIPDWARNDRTLESMFSDDFNRVLKGRIARDASRGKLDSDNPMSARDYAAVKAAMPFKADELNGSSITGQGAEWVSIFYDTRLWERARNETKLLDLLSTKGMRIADIPQGSNSINVKLNTGSPTVYTRNEPTSIDGTGRPEVTVQTTPFTTSEVEVTAAEHVLSQSVTYRLDEDSIINVAQFINEDSNKTLAEAIEDALINADNRTAANTNINLIDGTPAGGNQKPLYLAWNGIRYNAIVTGSASQVSDKAAAALDIKFYLDALNLFPSAIRNQVDSMLYIVDYDTANETRALPELLTIDVAGARASIFAGKLNGLPLFDVELYTSGFHRLSNGDGKISATAGNNLYGSILAVYAPYWQYSRKRNVITEPQRDAHSGSTTFVTSVRHVLTARGANAANSVFNITV